MESWVLYDLSSYKLLDFYQPRYLFDIVEPTPRNIWVFVPLIYDVINHLCNKVKKITQK